MNQDNILDLIAEEKEENMCKEMRSRFVFVGEGVGRG